jgi:DNA-binding SARP family transcriptional activator
MMADSEKLSVQLLGPFSARLGHQIVTPTAGKQRQILAVLALRAGQVVSTATLAEELWAGRLPRSFAVTLQTYVFQLRRRLATALPDAQDSKQLLSTRHSGYLLECQTDVEEFRRLAHAGREAAEAGNPRAAAELLGRALSLWRGPGLGDVRLGPVLGVEAAALAETRLGILERRIESDLALHRHNDVTGELLSLVAEHPINENFCALLMRAFYHSGHADRALETFRRLRISLNQELGIDPGTRLQELHRAILAGELAAGTDGPATRASRAGHRYADRRER